MNKKFDEYSRYQKINKKTKQEIKEFLKMLNEFRTLDYEKKINYIKDKYGKIEEKTLYFAGNCKLDIKFGEDKKYHFCFELENGDTKIFQKVFPELSQLIKNKQFEEIKKLYPEFKYFYYPTQEESDDFVYTPHTECINYYNNINTSQEEE